MLGIPHISDREWLVMTKLWEKYPQTAAEISGKVQAEIGIGDSSVRTMLSRLVKKKAVGYTVDKRNPNLYFYTPLICEKDCMKKESKHFLELYYRNNVSELLASFVNDENLSESDIMNLKQMIDERAKALR